MSENKEEVQNEATKTITLTKDGVIDRIMASFHLAYKPTPVWTGEEVGAWTELSNKLLNSLKQRELNDILISELNLLGAIAEDLTKLSTSVVVNFAERNNIKTMPTLLKRLRVETVPDMVYRNDNNKHLDTLVSNGLFIQKPGNKKKSKKTN